jgi:hypothetical protein
MFSRNLQERVANIEAEDRVGGVEAAHPVAVTGCCRT